MRPRNRCTPSPFLGGSICLIESIFAGVFTPLSETACPIWAIQLAGTCTYLCGPLDSLSLLCPKGLLASRYNFLFLPLPYMNDMSSATTVTPSRPSRALGSLLWNFCGVEGNPNGILNHLYFSNGVQNAMKSLECCANFTCRNPSLVSNRETSWLHLVQIICHTV